MDINLRKIYPLLKAWNIIHAPGGNEEAAANMLWGSQLHRLFGPAKVDGIIGASGARILVTLLHALKSRNLKRGVAALCLGGGEAVALGIEMTAG